MAQRRPSKRQDLSLYSFYDDFGGSSYDSAMWAARGTGGSLALQTDGSLRVRATANNSYELYQNDLPDFSVAKLATIYARYRVSSTASMAGEVGFEAASPNNTSNWITLHYDSVLGANWQAQCASGGSTTTVDTGVAANTSYHEFRIECKTGSVVFFLDGTLVATITTNIPSLLLQPYAFVVSKTGATKDLFFDWLECTGERE